MQSTGKRLGVMLWEIQNKNPGEQNFKMKNSNLINSIRSVDTAPRGYGCFKTHPDMKKNHAIKLDGQLLITKQH